MQQQNPVLADTAVSPVSPVCLPPCLDNTAPVNGSSMQCQRRRTAMNTVVTATAATTNRSVDHPRHSADVYSTTAAPSSSAHRYDPSRFTDVINRVSVNRRGNRRSIGTLPTRADVRCSSLPTKLTQPGKLPTQC